MSMPGGRGVAQCPRPPRLGNVVDTAHPRSLTWRGTARPWAGSRLSALPSDRCSRSGRKPTIPRAPGKRQGRSRCRWSARPAGVGVRSAVLSEPDPGILHLHWRWARGLWLGVGIEAASRAVVRPAVRRPRPSAGTGVGLAGVAGPAPVVRRALPPASGPLSRRGTGVGLARAAGAVVPPAWAEPHPPVVGRRRRAHRTRRGPGSTGHTSRST